MILVYVNSFRVDEEQRLLGVLTTVFLAVTDYQK